MTTNEKLAVLRAAMAKEGAAACLIPSSDPHISEYLPAHWSARRYFSGFTGSVGTLVVTRDKSALWVDGRYFVQAEKQLSGSEIELQRISLPGVPTVTEYLKNALGAGDVLALDGGIASTALFKELQTALAEKGASVRDLDLASPNWPGRPPVPATPAWLLSEQYAGQPAAEKLARLRKQLTEAGATAQVVTRLDSTAWLLNLRAADLECTPFALAWCWVTQADATLFIDGSRLPAEARQGLEAQGIAVREYGQLLEILAAHTAPETVLVEEAGTNYAIYNALTENPALTIKAGEDPIQAMKSVKSEAELTNIRHAHEKDGAAMVRFQMALEAALAAGQPLTEWDIGGMLAAERAKEEGYLMESFAPIAAYGGNAAMMHYQATEESHAALEPHGFLLVDTGGQYLDGTTDITRTYPLGPLTEEEKTWYTLVLKSHIGMARAVFLEGCTGGNLDILARSTVWRQGIDYRCGTGHGVGFVGGVHEGPQNLRINNNVKFQPGMTITDEPGIYETGKVGIRIENELTCVQLMETEYGRFFGFEPITYCPIALAAVRPELLNADEVRWINEYHAMVYATLAPRLDEAQRAWLAQKTAPLAQA